MIARLLSRFADHHVRADLDKAHDTRDQYHEAARHFADRFKEARAEARGARSDYEELKGINTDLADERDKLRTELDRVRTNRDQVADSLSAVWDALGLKTASDGNAVDAIRKLRADLAAERARTQETQPGAYLIWSHHHDAWWGPNAQGYRGNVADAGRYATRDAAVNRYKGRGCYCCVVPEVAVPAPLPGQMDSASLVKLIAVATEAEVAAGRVNKHAETARTQETQP